MKCFLISLSNEDRFTCVTDEQYLIGQDPSLSQILLLDQSVEGTHSILSFREERWFIEDLSSNSGSFLNEARLLKGQLYPLEAGDVLRFGSRRFLFSYKPPLAVHTKLFSEFEDFQGKEVHLSSLIMKLASLLDLKQELKDFFSSLVKLLGQVFSPESVVFLHKKKRFVFGLDKDDGYIDLLRYKSRYQTNYLSFFEEGSKNDEPVVLYWPLIHQGRMEGSCYLTASSGNHFSLEQLSLFKSLMEFSAGALGAFHTLQRAKEDREILHLNLIGIAPIMQELKIQLLRKARQKVPVLICGEDGVGKSRIARSVHQASGRRQAPMAVLSTLNLPKELFESEICGSLTELSDGSKSITSGLAIQASGGSLFIEDLNEVPFGIQPTLVTLIRTGQFLPIGAEVPIHVDLRVIATSSIPLDELKSQSRLIPELLELFEPHVLVVPPLRERQEDIPQLFRTFLGRFGEEEGLPTVVVIDEALSLLENHPWKLNIRELRQIVSYCFYELVPSYPIVNAAVVERALSHYQNDQSFSDGSLFGKGRLESEVNKLELKLIQEALMASNDDLSSVAKSLGLSQIILHRKMRNLGIG